LRWLFFLAYGCSGLAGLVYEVSWTRLLTLHMGHTTAAASTVVAAFMGGLAAGAAIGGRLVTRLTPRACLLAYIALEAIVALSAIALPYELNALEPLLGWAYRDGAPGALFPVVRILSSLVLLFVPSAALGATYPVAVQWYLSSQTNIGRAGGALYAVNTAGAVLGALAAGFFLIPAVGVSGTIRVGLLATTTAIMLAAVAVRDRYVGSGFSRIATVDRIAERSG
jgi:spermidine synthase